MNEGGEEDEDGDEEAEDSTRRLSVRCIFCFKSDVTSKAHFKKMSLGFILSSCPTIYSYYL